MPLVFTLFRLETDLRNVAHITALHGLLVLSVMYGLSVHHRFLLRIPNFYQIACCNARRRLLAGQYRRLRYNKPAFLAVISQVRYDVAVRLRLHGQFKLLMSRE